MAGSPTLLINGVDPFLHDAPRDCGISCRLYRDENNQIVPAPSAEQLRAALAAASRTEEPHRPEVSARSATRKPESLGVVLSAWRTRSVPMDPLEQAVHRAILRGFANTGQPPSLEQLEKETGANRHALQDVLGRLHDSDAIRLDTHGMIAVAYPFSSTPTRHQVHIANRIEAHAMCGIDALGIPAMLGEDVRIETTDPTTGDPIAIATTAGQATWSPPTAVAFIGADAGGGPSADSCCEYLNLFTSKATAEAWAAAHPAIHGEVLTQSEAEDLANSLFGALLAQGGAVTA